MRDKRSSDRNGGQVYSARRREYGRELSEKGRKTEEGKFLKRRDGKPVADQETKTGSRQGEKSENVQGRKQHNLNGGMKDSIPQEKKRTEYFCPVDRKCGGCQYLNLSYQKQLRIKIGRAHV